MSLYLRPLVVDLDGTLLRTDLLAETANAFVARRPFSIWRAAHWLAAGGKSKLKTELANATSIDPALLPYNDEVLAWLRHEKSTGRTIVLATASHKSLADGVARHLGIFDDVLATDVTHNLKGPNKRKALVERFGERGFDYVGDDAADLPVWAAAFEAWLVNPSARLESRARQVASVGGVIRSAIQPSHRVLARTLRVHQWLKNLLVFVPLVTAHRVGALADLQAAVIAFVCFSICASSVYVLNDLLDIADDRRHPRKRTRPFASGELSVLAGWALFPALLLLAFGLASASLPPAFLVVLGGYYALTLAYSFFIKRLLALDVVTLALLYTTRVIAGAVAIAVPLSFWLLAFAMFVFTSLAFIKRYTELTNAGQSGGGEPGRGRGRGYRADDADMLAALGASAGYLAVMVLALYIQDPKTMLLYLHPEFIWPACPLLLYWISRVWIIARRGQMHDDPVVFAVKDKASLVTALLFVVIFALAQ
jgi:4-hydroxybenzoate polyprenyltransferase/phosphoserine phosphatase